jgi:hypothetical protein
MPSFSRATSGALLVAAAVAALLSPLHASAQTYTAKALKLPKSTSCDWKIVRLAENGDVAAGCQFQRTLTFSDWVALLTTGSGQTTKDVIHVWRANGTTQILTGGTDKNANAQMTAILANGNVIGYSLLGWTQWKGTVRFPWAAPVSLGANAVVPDPDNPSYLVSEGRACLWNGSAWAVAPSLPLNNPVPALVDGRAYNRGEYDLDGVSRTGQMLIESEVAWLWSGGTNFQPFDATVQAVAGNDDVIGGTGLNWNTSTASATVWRNGVALDLNSRTTVPTGLKLITVVSGNKKGQLLVLAEPPDHSKWPSLLLLTPK